MITNIRSDRMVVFSDLHLGNPFCRHKWRMLAFLRWASEQGYDICLNGDALEIAQVSFTKLARDVPDVIRLLAQLAKRGTRIWYVVGNHDMAMEHFLNQWGTFTVCPFLNIESGGKRIRVEHGHLYDPFFVKHPALYEFVTWISGFFLTVSPGLYKAWVWFERTRSRFRGVSPHGIVGEPHDFATAADEIARRGFDAVVFGHTHHVGQAQLDGGARYFNPGSWLLGTHFVEIDGGVVKLKAWKPDRVGRTRLRG